MVRRREKSVGNAPKGAELLSSIPQGDIVSHLAVASDGRSFVSATCPINGGGVVRVWDLESTQLVRESRLKSRIAALGITSTYIVIASGQRVRIVDFQTLKSVEEFEVTTSGGIESVAISAEGRRIVFGCSDGTLSLWDSKSWRLERTLVGHQTVTIGVALTPAGYLGVSGHEKQALVWDLEAGKVIASLEGHQQQVNSVGVTNDLRFIVSCSSDNTVRVWDLDTKRSLRTLEGRWTALSCSHEAILLKRFR